ncbi:MAG: hypothetical protein DMF98_21855 [Acidobacteria bacterium]|nr:MAG: hypothetical protein DMF98_21855 [Acidobacteriota bacterium]
MPRTSENALDLRHGRSHVLCDSPEFVRTLAPCRPTPIRTDERFEVLPERRLEFLCGRSMFDVVDVPEKHLVQVRERLFRYELTHFRCVLAVLRHVQLELARLQCLEVVDHDLVRP